MLESSNNRSQCTHCFAWQAVCVQLYPAAVQGQTAMRGYCITPLHSAAAGWRPVTSRLARQLCQCLKLCAPPWLLQRAHTLSAQRTPDSAKHHPASRRSRCSRQGDTLYRSHWINNMQQYARHMTRKKVFKKDTLLIRMWVGCAM